ncbi:MAG TPA: hypothetical protein VL614_15155 [Acetobacteraceae bacterium]|jgi:hypothetical protein|nr:hypothetical protein [Acetobacteraceae bacterium]
MTTDVRDTLRGLQLGGSATIHLAGSLRQQDRAYMAVNTAAYRMLGSGRYTLHRLSDPPRVIITHAVQPRHYSVDRDRINNMLAEGMIP